MSNFRPDQSHVAQQSRRDKLRIQPCSNLEDYAHNLGQNLGNNPDFIQFRNQRNSNLLYDPSLGSGEMISFSMNQDVLSTHRNAMLHQDLTSAHSSNKSMMGGEDLFTNLPQHVSPQFNVSSRSGGNVFQSCGNWKSIDSQPNTGWVVNYASGSGSGIGEALFNDNVKGSNICSTKKYLKPNSFDEYQRYDQSNFTNQSNEISSQDRIHCPTSVYQDTGNDGVTLAAIGTQALEVASLVQPNSRGTGAWEDSGNELVLLPTYATQSSGLRYEDNSAWINRPDENCNQWSAQSSYIGEKSLLDSRNAVNDATTQGLSLSLSSNPPSKMYVAQLGDGYETVDVQARMDNFKEPQDPKASKSAYPYALPKPSIISRGCGKSLHELVGGSNCNINRTGGPLGPFTGYATILKSSRFLKPAQELLDEFCTLAGTKVANTDAFDRSHSDQISASVSASADGDDLGINDKDIGRKGNSSSAISSSIFHGSNQISCDGGVGSSSSESYRPEHQQKKAKLLYMQEEVGYVYSVIAQHFILLLFIGHLHRTREFSDLKLEGK